MRKTLTICAAAVATVAVMLAPAASSAKPDDSKGGKNAIAKQCAAQKKADKAAFKALYGKHAMRTCIKGEEPVLVAEFKNAAKECKAAREADPEAFAAEWGTKSQKNALGKCVSATVKAEEEEEPVEEAPTS